MKTLTEFDGFSLRNAITKKKELLAAGKTAEELPQALGEALKVEGDRLTLLLAAVELTESKTDQLKRVVVYSVEEGKSAPKGTVEKDGKHFLTEFFFAPSSQKAPRDEKGRGGGRDKKGGRGGKPRGGGQKREAGGGPGGPNRGAPSGPGRGAPNAPGRGGPGGGAGGGGGRDRRPPRDGAKPNVSAKPHVLPKPLDRKPEVAQTAKTTEPDNNGSTPASS